MRLNGFERGGIRAVVVRKQMSTIVSKDIGICCDRS
jgi:hypothetical protein